MPLKTKVINHLLTHPEHFSPDNKVHGASMGPTWVLSAPDEPHVGPVNLAIRVQTNLMSKLWLQTTDVFATFWTPLLLVFSRSSKLALKSVCFASWLIWKLTRSTTWKHYAKLACDRRFWKTIMCRIYMPTLVKIKCQRLWLSYTQHFIATLFNTRPVRR